MRRAAGQRRTASPRPRDREVADGRRSSPLQLDVGCEHDHVGAGDGAQRPSSSRVPTARARRSRSAGRARSRIATRAALARRRCARGPTAPPRGGMKSMTRTAPVVGLEASSRGSACRRDSARDRAHARRRARAASDRAPASPSSAAKQAPESKRGQHSQSIEPSRQTSAAVSQSPMSA